MAFHQGRFSAAGALTDPHTVAVFVNVTVRKPLFLKHFQHTFCLLLLMVGGGGDQGQLDLTVDDRILVFFHKLQCLLNLFVFYEGVKFLAYLF